ncbi:MAG TPA: TetR family transcriptional regulator [Clostridiales bacterium]|nr:TetR family transcriptional regulator [Clostridiales bacterium]
MSKPRNQYYKNTDKKIQNAMLELLQTKEIHKITVNDICSKAEINRSSFYAHYENIYDLMEKMEKEIELGVVEIYKNSDISLDNFFSERREEYLAIMIRFIGQHRDFYRAYMKLHPSNDIVSSMRLLLETGSRPYFDLLGLESEKDIIYHLTFFNKGMMSVIQYWIDTGCEETPEYLSNLIWKGITDLGKR